MQQNTAEWLEFRRTHIGASDAAPILGISPWKTAYQLWQDKLFGKVEELNSSMMRGHDLEPTARAQFEKLTGISVMPKVVVSKERPWQMASLDGISFDEDVIVEIKCPNREVHEMAKQGRLPKYYESQIQHQISVTGVAEALYYSFDGRDGVLVKVKRDQAYIDTLTEREEAFWNRVVNREAPELSERDYVEMKSKEWSAAAYDWKQAMERLKESELEEKSLRQRLIDLARDGNCQGAGVRLSKRYRQGNINYKEIPEIKGINLEVYRGKPVTFWNIAVI